MLIKFVEIPCIGLSEKISTKLNGAVKKVNNLYRGMQKNSAERTKTAEQHSCEGYSVAYACT